MKVTNKKQTSTTLLNSKSGVTSDAIWLIVVMCVSVHTHALRVEYEGNSEGTQNSSLSN